MNTTTRVGKIARLPHHVRNILNRRIQDGEPGKTLVGWINGIEEVQAVLKYQFGGRPVTEQNLSDWKQGGYQDWLRHEESRQLITGLAEEQGELDDAADGMEISDSFATLLSAEFVALTRKLLEEKTDPEKRWQCLREVLHELSQLRRDDHRAVRTTIKRARWYREIEQEEEEYLERQKKENKERLRDLCLSGIKNKAMVAVFGGGEYGKEMADLLHRIEFDLPFPDTVESASAKKDHKYAVENEPAQSNRIQPNRA
jgi:hypothetical protein